MRTPTTICEAEGALTTNKFLTKKEILARINETRAGVMDSPASGRHLESDS